MNSIRGNRTTKIVPVRFNETELKILKSLQKQLKLESVSETIRYCLGSVVEAGIKKWRKK